MPRVADSNPIERIERQIADAEVEIAKINVERETMALAAAKGEERASAKLDELTKARTQHAQRLENLGLALKAAKREQFAKADVARQGEIAQGEKTLRSEFLALIACAERADQHISALGDALKDMESRGRACAQAARFLFFSQCQEPTRPSAKDEWLRVRDASNANVNRATGAALAQALAKAGVNDIGPRTESIRITASGTSLSMKAATELAFDEVTGRLARLKGRQ